MLYIVINKDNVVTEIIPEFIPELPNVPVLDRYEQDFIKKCIVINDDSPCENGWIYDIDSNSFYEQSAPSPSLSLDEAILYKCNEINVECENAVMNGFDYNGAHYSLSVNDQSNLISMASLANNGHGVPYHADGEECRIYSADEFLMLVNSATLFKTHHTTYCNLLKLMISGITCTDDVYAVKYGETELTGTYKERYDEIMAAIAA